MECGLLRCGCPTARRSRCVPIAAGERGIDRAGARPALLPRRARSGLCEPVGTSCAVLGALLAPLFASVRLEAPASRQHPGLDALSLGEDLVVPSLVPDGSREVVEGTAVVAVIVPLAKALAPHPRVFDSPRER